MGQEKCLTGAAPAMWLLGSYQPINLLTNDSVSIFKRTGGSCESLLVALSTLRQSFLLSLTDLLWKHPSKALTLLHDH